MYICGKSRAAGRVGSGQTFCRQSRVGRVGSGQRFAGSILNWIELIALTKNKEFQLLRMDQTRNYKLSSSMDFFF